ncbi:TrmB family transcriptional regulator [Candidatus Bathyarchaeota archaeon]|nr:TrmB family transcriptional regulator [Candidatus Bathyarchaeota archaeon]MBS7630327.1 TrmB family transcriptional regulator [Candidatus Bathyarchaeota archaeon]
MKVERALKEIGLTEYEILAYLALINSGELTAGEISHIASIPYSKVYSVLDNLERKGWIEIKGGRPRLYYPRAPSEALRAERSRQESLFEQYQQLIVSELQPIFVQRKIKERPEIWIIRGSANIVANINEIIERTKSELMIALPRIPNQLSKVTFQILSKLKDKRVNILLLTTKDSIKHLDKLPIYLAELRIRNEMFGGGLVSDERESLLFLGEGGRDQEALAIWSDHAGLTSIAKIYFKHLWDTAESY